MTAKYESSTGNLLFREGWREVPAERGYCGLGPEGMNEQVQLSPAAAYEFDRLSELCRQKKISPLEYGHRIKDLVGNEYRRRS